MNTAELVLLRKRYRNWPTLALDRLRSRAAQRLVLRDGLVLESPPGDLLGLAEEIFFGEVYCPRGFEISADDTVVDIGANVGTFTLYAARRTLRAVYAYEPFPSNFAFLQANLQRNEVRHAVCRNQALSDRVGEARLFLSDSPAGHLLFERNLHGPLQHSLAVPTTTLSALIDEHRLERIDLLKLDCEGSEGAILRSTPRGDLERIRRISLEFHDNVSCLDHRAIAQLLSEHGYATRLRWDGRSPFGYLYATRSS